MIHPLKNPYMPKPSVSLVIIVKQEFKILHSEKEKSHTVIVTRSTNPSTAALQANSTKFWFT